MMRFHTGFGLDHVFVTHLHGDHVLGIPGLVQTLGFNGRDAPLAVHGPPGSRQQLVDLVHAAGHDPDFPVRVTEVSPGGVALNREAYEVRAFRTEHRTTSVGYALVEADRPGRFDRETAEEELDIPPGPAYGRLHAGETVELDDGRVITPEQVVGPPRPGRRVVYTGDTRPAETTVEAARDADLLVHDATFADDETGRARSTGHSTAREAGETATRASAKRLALTHVSSRYAGDASRLAAEAREAFDGEAFVPDDGRTVEVPYPDADEE
jgi:ribonuclease Z